MELERTYTNYVASQSQPHGQDYSINHHGNYPFAFVKYKQSQVSRQNTFILEVKENNYDPIRKLIALPKDIDQPCKPTTAALGLKNCGDL